MSSFFDEAEEPKTVTHSAIRLLGSDVIIVIGSILATLVAEFFLPLSAVFEGFEKAFLRVLPFPLRAPLMVFIYALAGSFASSLYWLSFWMVLAGNALNLQYLELD